MARGLRPSAILEFKVQIRLSAAERDEWFFPRNWREEINPV
jgi:hypothetical protein